VKEYHYLNNNINNNNNMRIKYLLEINNETCINYLIIKYR